MQEDRPGNVSGAIRSLAGVDVGELVPAIDDREARIVEMPGEDLGGDQGGMHDIFLETCVRTRKTSFRSLWSPRKPGANPPTSTAERSSGRPLARNQSAASCGPNSARRNSWKCCMPSSIGD